MLQGYSIGNPATDSSTDNLNISDLFSHWPIIAQNLSSALTAYNCGTVFNPIGAWLLMTLHCYLPTPLLSACLAWSLPYLGHASCGLLPDGHQLQYLLSHCQGQWSASYVYPHPWAASIDNISA